MSERPKVGRVIPNAPVQLPNRQRLFHTPPSWVRSGEVYFITICCTPRHKNQLAVPSAFQVITDSIEHNIGSGKLWAYLVLAMPDHLHALLACPTGEQLNTVIRNWKRFVAKTAEVKWQDGFFDHRLRSNESFEEKSHYIRMNPVRAGLVTQAERWPYVWPARACEAAR